MKYSMGESFRMMPRYLDINTFSTGTLAAIFGCTGPALIIIGGLC